MALLYIAGVSISENPKHISPVTLKIIKECDAAIGEERKNSLRLLNAAECPDKRLFLINEHSGDGERREALAAVMEYDKSIFFSDAGTPCISDPDHEFIALCRDAGVRIKSIPGPSSVTAAISVSGIAAETFFFAGFPPREKEKRKGFFDKISKSKHTTVFMERPYALEKVLADMSGIKRNISLSVNLGHEDEITYFDTPDKLLKITAGIKAPFIAVVPPAGKSGR